MTETMTGLANLIEEDATLLHPELRCPVLILRAPEGMLAADDLLLPEDALSEMLRQIPDARGVDVPGSNHYSIVFC